MSPKCFECHKPMREIIGNLGIWKCDTCSLYWDEDDMIEPDGLVEKFEGVSKTKARFELFKGKDKKWFFRLKATNGKIIAQSEGYNRRASALKGIQSVRRNAAKAELIEA